MTSFQDAVAGLVGKVSADVIECVAAGIAAEESKEAVLDDLGADADDVAPLLAALAARGLPPTEAAAYLS